MAAGRKLNGDLKAIRLAGYYSFADHNIVNDQAGAIVVEAGDYKSASEVVRDALRLLRDERERAESKLEILRREVGKGLAEAERGDFSTRTVGDIATGVLHRRSRRTG